MSTNVHNPLTINAVRTHPGRLLAAAAGLLAVIACAIAIALGQASGGGATASPEPATGARPDPAILHHHGLNTVDPDPAARVRRHVERFHHR
jgi:hypothetical protein